MEKLLEGIGLLFEKQPVIALIIIFMLLVLSAIVGLIVLVVSGKLKIPDLKKNDPVDPTKPHEGCPYNVDRMIEAQKCFERGMAMGILHNQQVKESMEESELVIDNIHREMSRLFYKIVAEKAGTIDGAMKHPESVHYKKLVWEALNKDCKDYFRHCVRENHFYKKSEGEFQVYVDEQIKELVETITEFLDLYYNPVIISNEELFERNQVIMPTIKTEISRLYYKARSISFDKIEQACNILDAQGIFDVVQREKELERI
jgi:hypothetical protein